MKFPLILLILLFSGLHSWGGELNGKVVGVHDRDTITVLAEKTQTKIRLAGIDAPESKQDFGNVAKRTLSELVFGRNVRVVDKGKDRYGRVIGDVYVGEEWINLMLVEMGVAWVYLKYSHDPNLVAAEAKAKSEGTGRWRDANPVAPWEWRQGSVTR